jgi:predicted GIY-YIG superfamily endonuclease
MDTLYLIHFAKPYKHARHYLGVTNNLDHRLALHRSGSGARLLDVVNKAGIEWECVRTWAVPEGLTGRQAELALKAQKNTPDLCPICNGRAATNKREAKRRAR